MQRLWVDRRAARTLTGLFQACQDQSDIARHPQLGEGITRAMGARLIL